jgi:nucleotide-binding universal stress UspA family protein
MKHILVPVDGSECTPVAIEKAKELAGVFGSKITLLNVYTIPYMSSELDFNVAVWIDSMKEYTMKKSRDTLEDAKALCRGMEVEIETVSLEGNPADQIIDYVSQHDDIDLVIMGTYGMGGFRRFFLGSTTHKVAVAIEKPILII